MFSRKSTTYQHLEDALQEPGCPICRIGQDAAHRYLDSILYESVNDPRVRLNLAKSLGFCFDHSREMLTFPGERLGIAIIEQDMLKQALKLLHQHQGPSRRNRFRQRQQNQNQQQASGSDRNLSQLAPCPACEHRNEGEDRAMKELVKHLVGDLEAPLRTAGGLCLPHLQQTLRLCNNAKTFNTLINLHEMIWAEQIDHLGEFIRKYDYRFRHEGITDDESASIERAMDILTGERSL